MKKIISLFLSFVLLCSFFGTIVAADMSFLSDVEELGASSFGDEGIEPYVIKCIH